MFSTYHPVVFSPHSFCRNFHLHHCHWRNITTQKWKKDSTLVNRDDIQDAEDSPVWRAGAQDVHLLEMKEHCSRSIVLQGGHGCSSMRYNQGGGQTCVLPTAVRKQTDKSTQSSARPWRKKGEHWQPFPTSTVCTHIHSPTLSHTQTDTHLPTYTYSVTL
jgi:hypothetical protein